MSEPITDAGRKTVDAWTLMVEADDELRGAIQRDIVRIEQEMVEVYLELYATEQEAAIKARAEAKAIATYLTSPEAERALAEALNKIYEDTDGEGWRLWLGTVDGGIGGGPIPESIARAILAAWPKP